MNLEENLTILGWLKDKFECSEPCRCSEPECKNFCVYISYGGEGRCLPYVFSKCLFSGHYTYNNKFEEPSCSNNNFCHDHKDKLTIFIGKSKYQYKVCYNCLDKAVQIDWNKL